MRLSPSAELIRTCPAVLLGGCCLPSPFALLRALVRTLGRAFSRMQAAPLRAGGLPHTMFTHWSASGGIQSEFWVLPVPCDTPWDLATGPRLSSGFLVPAIDPDSDLPLLSGEACPPGLVLQATVPPQPWPCTGFTLQFCPLTPCGSL